MFEFGFNLYILKLQRLRFDKSEKYKDRHSRIYCFVFFNLLIILKFSVFSFMDFSELRSQTIIIETYVRFQGRIRVFTFSQFFGKFVGYFTITFYNLRKIGFNFCNFCIGQF